MRQEVIITVSCDSSEIQPYDTLRRMIEVMLEDFRECNIPKTGRIGVFKGRDRILEGETHRVEVEFPNRHLFVTVNFQDGEPFEIFTCGTKDTNSEYSANLEGYGRLVSKMLQFHIPILIIIDQLRGVQSEPFYHNGHQILSIPDAIAQVLSGEIKEDR